MKIKILLIMAIAITISGCREHTEKYTSSFELSPSTSIENDYAWTMGNNESLKTFTAISESEIKVSNPSDTSREIIRPSIYEDNYRIFTNIQVITYTQYSLVTYGVIPYYIDIENYIAIYLNFNGNGTLRCISCTGKFNGIAIEVIDFWSFKNHTPILGGKEGLVIERHQNLLTVNFMNHSETKTIKEMCQPNKYVGVYVTNYEEVTYSNFKQFYDETIDDSPIWTETECWFEQSYIGIDSENIEISNYNNWMSGYLIQDSEFEDYYSISVNIKADKDRYTSDENTQIGIIPFFQNLDNYLLVYLQWKEDQTLKSIGLTGTMSGEWIGWHDMWDYQGMDTKLLTGMTLRVIRSSKDIITIFNNTIITRTFEEIENKSNYSIGVWVHNAKVSFTSFKQEKMNEY